MRIKFCDASSLNPLSCWLVGDWYSQSQFCQRIYFFKLYMKNRSFPLKISCSLLVKWSHRNTWSPWVSTLLSVLTFSILSPITVNRCKSYLILLNMAATIFHTELQLFRHADLKVLWVWIHTEEILTEAISSKTEHFKKLSWFLLLGLKMWLQRIVTEMKDC